MSSDTWIMDLRNFLGDKGEIAPMPGPARRLAEHLAAIVAMATHGERGEVACRRRPGRRPCAGRIAASIEEDTGEIDWQCPECGDSGLITGWEGTFWDVRPELRPDYGRRRTRRDVAF